jgi:hypothetical protein
MLSIVRHKLNIVRLQPQEIVKAVTSKSIETLQAQYLVVVEVADRIERSRTWTAVASIDGRWATV